MTDQELIFVKNAAPVPGITSWTPTVAVEYPTPPLSTVTLSTLPLEIDDMIFAPTPSPKIFKSGVDVYSSPERVTITDCIFPFVTIALYSEDEPEETRTWGGMLKLNVESFPYPSPDFSTLIDVIEPLTIGLTLAWKFSVVVLTPVSYTHLTLPTMDSV